MARKRDIFDEAAESMGGLEQIHTDLEDFSRRHDMLLENQERWLEEYPDKWVAITDQDDLIVADDLEELVRKAKEAGTRLDNFVYTHLDTVPETRVL